MPECELCGKSMPRLKKVLIEGVVLNVCDSCARHGRTLKKGEEKYYAPGNPSIIRERLKRKDRPVYRDVPLEEEEVLAEDYSDRVRNARLQMGLTQEELARRILEKESVIAKIERGEMHPDRKLIRKLEKTLGIKLTEKVTPVRVDRGKAKGGALTLGDLLSMKMKEERRG